MMFGIIYEYVERSTGLSAYVGKAAGLYGTWKTLKVAHLRHMRGHDPVPFDFLLRENEPGFDLHIVDAVTSATSGSLQAALKPMEHARIGMLRPRYNCVGCENKAKMMTSASV